MIEISKELLSEVLNCNVDKYTIVSSTEITQIRIWKKDAEMWDYRSYDIYHLAHKCKEWAWNNFGLNIFIEKHTFDLYEASIKICRFNNKFGSYNSFCSYYPKENTEVEAIIKACEWILKELKK